MSRLYGFIIFSHPISTVIGRTHSFLPSFVGSLVVPIFYYSVVPIVSYGATPNKLWWYP